MKLQKNITYTQLKLICDKLRELYPNLTIKNKYKEYIGNIILYRFSTFLFRSGNLNNLLDEDLVNVYNIAELFDGLEKHPLTDGQIKRINQILLEINKERATNDISPAKGMLAQVKNRKINFALSNEEKQVLTKEEIEQKLEKQIDQICGMVEVAEIARTTENPEVLKAIMEQKCFKFDLNILFAILNNKNINDGTLCSCIYSLGKICEKYKDSKNSKIQEQCIELIIKILDKANSNPDILYDCIQVLKNICQEFKDSENSKILKQCFEGITTKILKNKNINEYILCDCICSLGEICEKYKDSENSEIQKQCIELIIKILDNPNYNSNSDILSKCACALENIYQEFKGSENSEILKLCFEEIIKISKNDKIYQDTLYDCIRSLKKICIRSEDSEIKGKCIETIIEISNNKDTDPYILSKCACALRNICQQFKGSENSEILKLCFEEIIKISKNDKIYQDTLYDCIHSLKKICIRSEDSEIKEKCIQEIKEILEDYIEILEEYIETLNNENDNSDILSICEYCINALGDIAADPRIEDRQECIEAIIKISQNEKAGSFLLDDSLTLKEFAESVLRGLGREVSNEQSENETQKSNYYESKQISPETNTAIIVSGSDDQSDNNKNQSIVQPVIQSVAQSSNHVDNQSKKGQGNTKSCGM